MARLKSGDRLLDLYSGSGLFAASLAHEVGDQGVVVGVETSVDAVRNARRSCSDLGNLELVTADVARWINTCTDQFDVVVLDPPRAGAGKQVIDRIAQLATRVIVYVACEPSALARDTAFLAESGWVLESLVGLDAFPMTAHVECIGRFVRADGH